MSRSPADHGRPGQRAACLPERGCKNGARHKETFTLSGWAKGYGIVNREREGCPNPQFRLRVVIKYYDSVYREYGLEEHTAEFSPCTEEWQFASVQFSKEKYRVIQYAQVYCDYSYNCGTAYFDNIQLTETVWRPGFRRAIS